MIGMIGELPSMGRRGSGSQERRPAEKTAGVKFGRGRGEKLVWEGSFFLAWSQIGSGPDVVSAYLASSVVAPRSNPAPG